jgi:signal transduction histidine kinase
MKILANKKIKSLFCRVLIYILIFIVISVTLMNFQFRNGTLYLFLCSLCMVLAILIACYQYFKEQYKIIETADAQITEFIAGNQNARIECNDEGELYRLFHEVNSLVSILNARAENELREKEFLKNTISDISHQLKTPLAALNIYNGILQGEADNSPTILEFTNLSEQELDRIETLVQNLLKITKLDAGIIVMDKSLENVAEMMEHVKKHFSFRAAQEEKKISFTGSDTITLLCDRDWLMEAIDNIVKNALDHTKKGDSVFVEWKQFTSIIQMIVKDNGSGIHPEDLHYIFKRFYRSQFATDIQGIGLGLPLAKSIIEAHNGTVEVDSELGIGTTFVINFLIPTKL